MSGLPGALGRRSRLVLLALAVLVAALRLLVLDEPIERDAAIYMVVADEMLAGKLLYAEVWDHKPPGTFLLFAAVQALLGPGPGALFALGLAAALAALFGVHAAARRLSGDERGALWAAALWAVVQVTPFLQADLLNTEALLSVAVVWSLVLFLRAGDRRLGWGAAFALGAIAAAASLVKQVVLPPLAAMALVHLLAGGWIGVRARLPRLLAGFSLVPIAWAAVWLYFAARGETDAFVGAVVTYNQAYVAPLAATLRQALGWPEVGYLAAALAPPLVALVWLPRNARSESAPDRRLGALLLLAAGVGTWIAVSLPGHFYLHYYQLWLPLLCLALAVVWDLVRGREPGRPTAFSHACCALVVLAAVLVHREPFTRWTPEDWSRSKYGDEFVEVRRWGLRIGQLLRPEERLWQLGPDAGLYLYAGKRPPTRLLVDYPLGFLRHPQERIRAMSRRFMDETADEVARSRPDLVAVKAGHVLLAAEVVELNPISAVLARGYLRLQMPPESPYVLLVRRDSALLQRLPPQALRPPMEPHGTWRPPSGGTP